MAGDPIHIGVLATLLGPYRLLGEDGLRGAQLAVAEFGGEVAGCPIYLYEEGTNAIPQHATDMATKLLDRDGVDFIVGPLSGSEGIAIRDFAKTRPDRAFLNGSSGSQDLTLRDPAPNFFNFFSNGAQWMAGLGSYIYYNLGYRSVVTVAEDYPFPHSQVGAFMVEYCRVGGRVLDKHWVPLGTRDFSDIIEHIPSDIDAIFVALGGTDALHFIEQYDATGRRTPLVGGTILVDQTILGVDDALADHLIGTCSAAPLADDNPEPEWQNFVAAYRSEFPDGPPYPSVTAYGFYMNMKAALLGLDAIRGDLSNGQQAFLAALTRLEFYSPTGPVRVDHNRQAIMNNFITMVERNEDGKLVNRLVAIIDGVNNSLGLSEEEYLAIGPFNRDNPSVC